MRVLLLHEFSGVHTELRSALRRNGIDADIATFGDYHKGFESDYNLGTVNPGFGPAVGRVIQQLRNLAAYRNYDIIQSISPSPFNKILSKIIEPFLIGNRSLARYVYLSAGADVFYRENIYDLEYAPSIDAIDITAPDELERRVAQQADAMVSCTWEYHFTLKRAGYESIFIPLPVDTKRLPEIPVGRQRPVTVYHPINRKEGNDFKGTSHIKAAFDRLRPEFQSEAVFIERGGMSIREYHEFTKSVDIVVDQTNSYAYGMSGLYALARGQVLLSGNESRTHEFAVYRDSPVLNIKPDPNQIVEVLQRILRRPEMISSLGAAGRHHAESYHESDQIAKQYIALYLDLLAR
jgi:hypothetical protein